MVIAFSQSLSFTIHPALYVLGSIVSPAEMPFHRMAYPQYFCQFASYNLQIQTLKTEQRKITDKDKQRSKFMLYKPERAKIGASKCYMKDPPKTNTKSSCLEVGNKN